MVRKVSVLSALCGAICALAMLAVCGTASAQTPVHYAPLNAPRTGAERAGGTAV